MRMRKITHENMVKTGKTNVSTSKAHRGQVIYWKAGKLHIVGLSLGWTFHWWWLARILTTLVPRVNIFRALTFLVDESTSPSVYRLPYSTSTHWEAVEWVHYRRVNTCICPWKYILHCISTQMMAVLTVNWLYICVRYGTRLVVLPACRL